MNTFFPFCGGSPSCKRSFLMDHCLVAFKTTKEREKPEGCNILFLADCAGRAESLNIFFFKVAPHAPVAWILTR